MKSILNFFLKNVDHKRGIAYLQARSLTLMLVIIVMIVSILLIYLLLFSEIHKTYNVIGSLVAIVGTLFLIRSGRSQLAGDLLSLFLTAIMVVSISNVTRYPGPYYFFIQFYLFIAYIIFSAMFARLYAFFTIVGVTLVTAVVIHKLRFPFVPEFMRPTVEYGFPIYIMVVLIISVLSLIFTRFVASSMTQLDKSFHKSKEQNSVMQNVITGISQTSTRMTSLGKELNHTSEQVALNAETQAAQIEEISSEMEEMTGIVLNNSENAELSFKVFKESAEQLKRSSETIIKAVELINSISERTQHISDIAFQTNILALNASIESAKAKRFGAGFSVVADEVRKLATKSNSVSDEISNLTKLSFQITESLQKEMIENLAKSQETLSLIETISASGREQTMAIKSVNSAVQKLAEISTLNADSATKMNLFARELSQLSESSKQISQNVASAKK